MEGGGTPSGVCGCTGCAVGTGSNPRASASRAPCQASKASLIRSPVFMTLAIPPTSGTPTLPSVLRMPMPALRVLRRSVSGSLDFAGPGCCGGGELSPEAGGVDAGDTCNMTLAIERAILSGNAASLSAISFRSASCIGRLRSKVDRDATDEVSHHGCAQ